jgi:hypothetical protein
MCSSLLKVLIGLLHEAGELLLCDALHGEGHHCGRGGSAAHHLPATQQQTLLLHETGELLLCDALHREGHHCGRGGSAAHHLPATRQQTSLTQGFFQLV